MVPFFWTRYWQWCWLLDHQLNFTAERSNVHPAKWFIPSLFCWWGTRNSSRPVPQGGVQLCSKAEKCPFLLPKASSSSECQKPWLYPTPTHRVTAPSCRCCEQAVFSVWQTGTFWRCKLRNISFWKMWRICSAFCISQTVILVFSFSNLATEYMGPWL